jgi:hypothetical protein
VLSLPARFMELGGVARSEAVKCWPSKPSTAVRGPSFRRFAKHKVACVSRRSRPLNTAREARMSDRKVGEEEKNQALSTPLSKYCHCSRLEFTLGCGGRPEDPVVGELSILEYGIVAVQLGSASERQNLGSYRLPYSIGTHAAAGAVDCARAHPHSPCIAHAKVPEPIQFLTFGGMSCHLGATRGSA